MMEVGVLIDLNGQPLHWHLPENRSAAYLPDSVSLWKIIWNNREKISGFAHSHPGRGLPSPSQEDVSTFSGIEIALGRRWNWWITTQDQVKRFHWTGPTRYDYTEQLRVWAPLMWLPELRKHSNYEEK